MSEHLEPPAPDEPRDPEARLRSGTAARLAGIPVATLRIWQRRYGVVAATRSPSGQRLYAPADVQRLRLLRQLTGRGHGIGTIATLDLPALRALAGEQAPSAGMTTSGSGRLVVVGPSAVQRLQARGVPVSQALADLDEAEHAASAVPSPPGTDAPLLLVHLPSLQPAAATRVLALARRLGAASVGVLYAFGPEVVAESLRTAGAWVRREPVGSTDLAQLVASPAVRSPLVRASTDPAGRGREADAPPAAPRRFSDAALTQLASARSSGVACECPRHVAELVTQLVAFERYSSDCGDNGPRDAALHRYLGAQAGAARALLEQALARIVADEGLPVEAPR